MAPRLVVEPGNDVTEERQRDTTIHLRKGKRKEKTCASSSNACFHSFPIVSVSGCLFGEEKEMKQKSKKNRKISPPHTPF